MIKRLILHLLANTGALYATFILLQGDFLITGGWRGYAIGAMIFAILNGFVKPVIKILSLPFVLISAGLFTLVINMGIVWFAKYALDVLKFEGVTIQIAGSWVTYLYIGILMSIANMMIHWLLKN
ncbi:MAG: phage holin family protein [Candidatus Peregrinibacteria bacterium]